jgi:segregation and condensation protein A
VSSSSTPEPLDPSFKIQLPAFEGPLDLLLHLIKRHELDILDLPIAFVTERYLDYITVMERLNLDIASEYLVMAATLAYIKSRMLLPPDAVHEEEEESTEEELDPRAELIRRLLEYQKYKLVAEQLGARGVAGRDVFMRGAEAPEASGPAPLAASTLYQLLDAFQGILKRAQADLAFAITTEGVSIQQRMRELTEKLASRGEVAFEDLFAEQVSIYDLVITFLAILEMAKRRLLQLYQADAASALHVRSTVLSGEPTETNEVSEADQAPEVVSATEVAQEPATQPEPELRDASGMESTRDGNGDSS